MMKNIVFIVSFFLVSCVSYSPVDQKLPVKEQTIVKIVKVDQIKKGYLESPGLMRRREKERKLFLTPQKRAD